MHTHTPDPTKTRIAKYNAQIESALKEANAYNGKESKHDALNESIEKIRIRLTQILNLPIRNIPTKQQQIEFLHSLPVEQRKKNATISKIQAVARRALQVSLEKFEKSADIESLKRLGITIRDEVNINSENTVFTRIIELLQEIGIYTDDLLLSTNSKDYEEPYIEIEIPRVQKMVLLSRKNPNIIYISDTHYPKRKKKFTVKINIRERNNWKLIALEALLKNTCLYKKINIGEREHIVAELKKKYPTKKSFLEISRAKEKTGLKIGGRGLNAIATMFGIKEDPNIGTIFQELTDAIYDKPNAYSWESLDINEEPSNNTEMKNNSTEPSNEVGSELNNNNEEHPYIQAIKKLYPTAQNLLTLTIKERQKLKIEGIGLNQIARELELEWRPERSFKDHLEFVAYVYGENDEIQAKREDISKNEHEFNKEEEKETLKDNIKEQFPTSQAFLEMDRTTKNQLKILGLGFIATAKKLGIQNDPIKSMDAFVHLAEVIYGKDETVQLYFAVRDSKQVSELIRKTYPTRRDFESATYDELHDFKIADKKINALASILGVAGNPLVNPETRRLLTERIYNTPADEIAPITHVRRRSNPDKEGSVDTRESWKHDTIQEYPTSEDFLTMGKEKRFTCKIRNKGLKYLASVFGIEGDPIKQIKSFFSLAKAIYGNDSYIERCEADMRFGEFPSHYRFKRSEQ